MTEDLQRIRRYIAALVRRERGLILARMLLQALSLGFALEVVATVAASSRWDRSVATGAVVLLAGIGSWAAIMVPLVRRWRPASDPMRQAHLVEGLAPELRGRLVTAVERVGGPVGQESPEMLGLVARKALGAIGKVGPERVHPGRPLWGMVAGTVFASILAFLVTVLAPGGPFAAWRWWFQGTAAEAAMATNAAMPDGEHAKVGDLVLKYVYPEYTGLDPREITNSDGDAHGPPGTIVEVTARSAPPVEAGAVVAYEQPPTDAQVTENGERLSGQFTIEAKNGTWKLVTMRGGRSLDSRPFKIVVEPDLPPEVTLDTKSDRYEIAVDEPLEVQWHARDDYGLSLVAYQIEGRDPIKEALRKPSTGVTELDGDEHTTPASLGLKAGDHVRLRVAAWDNDAVYGVKMGVSRSIDVTVLGASGLSQRDDEQQRQLLDTLLGLLADHLEDPWPAGRTSGELATWGERLGKRYQPLDTLVDDRWHGRTRVTPETQIVNRIVASGRDLMTYTQVAFLAGSPRSPTDDELSVAADLRDKAIGSLEAGVLLLDHLIQQRALEDLLDTTRALAKTGDDLEREAANKADPQQMLARTDAFDQTLSHVTKAADKLDDQQIRDLVAQHAVEMKALDDEIRKSLGRGDTEDANRLLSRLARQAHDLDDAIQEELAKRQNHRDENQKKAADVMKELSELSRDQSKLQSDLHSVEQKSDAENSKKAEDLWRTLEEKAGKHADDANAYVEGVSLAKRPFNEIQRSRSAADRSGHLRDAIASHDVHAARHGVDTARQAWRLERMVVENGPTLAPGGPGRSELNRLDHEVDEIDGLLAQLDRASQQSDPQTQQQIQQLAQRQAQLQQRLDKTTSDAKELTEKLETRPQGVQEALDDARQAMDQAGQDMKGGKPVPAQGSQGTAARRIEDAKDALEQAMQQEGKGGGKGDGEGGKGGKDQQQGQGDKGDGQSESDSEMQRMQIPRPEDFQTPEEYRQELLDGMQGDVPDEYKALKKRYYEELVHQ